MRLLPRQAKPEGTGAPRPHAGTDASGENQRNGRPLMTYRESDIVHESGRFFVLRDRKPGLFRVLRIEATASVERGTFHFPNRPDYARQRAVDDCNRRAAGEESRRQVFEEMDSNSRVQVN